MYVCVSGSEVTYTHPMHTKQEENFHGETFWGRGGEVVRESAGAGVYILEKEESNPRFRERTFFTPVLCLNFVDYSISEGPPERPAPPLRLYGTYCGADARAPCRREIPINKHNVDTWLKHALVKHTPSEVQSM